MGAAAFLRETIDRCLLELCEWEKALKEGEFEFYHLGLDGNALGLLLLAEDYGLTSSSTYAAGYLQEHTLQTLQMNAIQDVDEKKTPADEYC